MNTLNLSLYPKNADGHWAVPMRNGETATIVTDKRPGNYPLVGWVKSESVFSWTAEGILYRYAPGGAYDLTPPKWHRERAAFERGERVEYQVYSAVAGWSPWADMSDWHKGQDWRWEDVDYRFRIAEPALHDWQRNARGWEDADPYAELKAAHKAGKLIQFFYLYLGAAERTWIDDPTPSWKHPVEFYRIKPELPPIPEGFTRWDGGECPVADNVRVEVILRNGDRGSGPAGFWTNFNNWWKHQGDPMNNIIAYRPLPPSFVPWNCPEDVPLNCWIRRKGAIWMGMVVGFYATGIRIITSSLDEVEYHELKDFEYSTDRKEWKPCTKEAK